MNISEKLSSKNENGILWQRHRAKNWKKRIKKLNDGFTYEWDEETQQFLYSSDEQQIPLHTASSMSRELFDLYYYLRLDAAPGDISNY